MNKVARDSTLRLLDQQRRRLSLALAGAIGLIIILSLSLLLMASKRERIVVVPHSFSEEFWLETTTVSSSYIRQVGDYFVKLALTVNPDTVESQYAFILKNVYPAYYGTLKADFIEKVAQVKKKSVSTVFRAREYEVDAKNLFVIIKGDLELTTGRQHLDPQEKQYKVSFVYDDGRLYIKEIKEV